MRIPLLASLLARHSSLSSIFHFPPSGGGTVRNMAATADGRVYIACSGVNKVGVVERAR